MYRGGFRNRYSNNPVSRTLWLGTGYIFLSMEGARPYLSSFPDGCRGVNSPFQTSAPFKRSECLVPALLHFAMPRASSAFPRMYAPFAPQFPDGGVSPLDSLRTTGRTRCPIVVANDERSARRTGADGSRWRVRRRHIIHFAGGAVSDIRFSHHRYRGGELKG